MAVDVVTGGFARVTAPVMTSAIRRANQADLQQFKRILESSPEPDQAGSGQP